MYKALFIFKFSLFLHNSASSEQLHFNPQHPFIKVPQLRYFKIQKNKLTTARKPFFTVVMRDQAGPFYT